MTDPAFLGQLGHRKPALLPYARLDRADLLRLLLRGEVEGEPIPGPEAVAWVVLNRVRHPLWWGESVCQVALWPHQFSCFWTDLDVRRTDMQQELCLPTPRLQGAVQRALYSDALGYLDRDPTGGALYYWNPDVVDPPWADRVTRTRRIGHHVFASDPALDVER